jgi:hypothetical protein
VQGDGLRQGGIVRRAQRRFDVAREVAGDLQFSPTTNGFGLWLQHMLGSFSAAPVSIGNGLYRQVHNPGSLQGKAFTTQIVRPDESGDLSQAAYTYPGCKITEWELSVAQGAEAKLKLTVDALDEATPSNTFAATTLAAVAAAAATSISTAVALPAGAYVVVDTGMSAEVVRTVGAATGSGPFVSTLVAPLQEAHASGVAVSSATGVNYGAATALQTATYNANTGLFLFNQGRLVTGGTVTQTAGVWTNSGGTTAAFVRGVTITGKNALKTDRWGLGSAIRGEQLENGFRDYTASVEVEFTSRAYYDAYVAGVPMDLQLSFTTPGGAVLSFYAPVGFQEDGGNASVSGPDLLEQKLSLTLLDDGVNGALQAVYTSTDSTI